MNTEKEQKEIEEKWQTERLEKQINFIREMDKEKFIGRQTYLSDGKRKENDAENKPHHPRNIHLVIKKEQHHDEYENCHKERFNDPGPAFLFFSYRDSNSPCLTVNRRKLSFSGDDIERKKGGNA